MCRVKKCIKNIIISMACFFVLLFGFCRNGYSAVIFDSSFSISEDYNDNLFFTATDREADFTTTLSPFLSIGYTSKNIAFTIGYQGAAQFHSNNPNVDGYFQALSIDLDLPILNRQIRGVEVRVTEDVTYSPELPGFTFGGGDKESDSGRSGTIREREGVGVQLNRTDTFENRAGISLSYDWTDHFSTASSYKNVITRYSGNEFKDRDAHHTTFDAAYRYPFSQRIEGTTRYDIGVTTGDGPDRFIQSLGLGFSYRMTPFMTATAGGGVSFVKDESPQYTFATGLLKRFQSGSLSIQYSNAIESGLGVVRSVTRDEAVTGQITQVLSESTSSYIRGGYSSTKSLSGNEVDTVATAAGAGISVRFLDWLEGGLSYDYLKQDAETRTTLGRDGERNRYMLTLTATGPSWRLMN